MRSGTKAPQANTAALPDLHDVVGVALEDLGARPALQGAEEGFSWQAGTAESQLAVIGSTPAAKEGG